MVYARNNKDSCDTDNAKNIRAQTNMLMPNWIILNNYLYE